MSTFEEMIKKSYGFNPTQFYTSPDWALMQKLFETNYHSNGSKYKIPKKIHQIWLGREFPDKYKKFAESWQKYHPTWEYRLWTDKDIPNLKITSKFYFDQAVNPAMRSDIMRYEILRQFGGLYVDTDFECLRPFDDLMYLDFFTGIGYDGVLQLYIGLLASIPNHPIMKDCVYITEPYQGGKGSIMMNVTGVNHFTKCFLKYAKGNVVAFPMDYFYPYPNNLKGLGDPYSYVTENTYAIHHWAVSWNRRYLKSIGYYA